MSYKIDKETLIAAVVQGLKDVIKVHGPITTRLTTSAAKRIAGRIIRTQPPVPPYRIRGEERKKYEKDYGDAVRERNEARQREKVLQARVQELEVRDG